MRLTPSLAMVGSLQFGLTGRFDCHVYALRGPRGVVLIDCGAGTNTEELLRNVFSEFGACPVESAIVTHAHADHCGGAAALREGAGCRILAPEPSRAILEQGDEQASGLHAARLQGSYPSDLRMTPCVVDAALRDGEVFEAGGIEFRAIHIRGHSRDSFCYLAEIDGGRSLFSGDAVFYGGVLGVINVEGSGMDGYRNDLGKLKDLSLDGLFPGHGLFVLKEAQRHVDQAISQAAKGFLPRQIGQGDAIF